MIFLLVFIQAACTAWIMSLSKHWSVIVPLVLYGLACLWTGWL